MAQRLKIGVDVDEVVADFISAFRVEAEAVLGKPFTEPASWYWGGKELVKVWDKIFDTPNWYMNNVKALPEVKAFLPALAKTYDTYFITARPETVGYSAKRQTEFFLSEMGIPFPTVIVEEKKGPVVAALHLDAFVDDKIANLEDIQQHSPSTLIFLMEQPYNINEIIPKEWNRVKSIRTFWLELEKYFN